MTLLATPTIGTTQSPTDPGNDMLLRTTPVSAAIRRRRLPILHATRASKCAPANTSGTQGDVRVVAGRLLGHNTCFGIAFPWHATARVEVPLLPPLRRARRHPSEPPTENARDKRVLCMSLKRIVIDQICARNKLRAKIREQNAGGCGLLANNAACIAGRSRSNHPSPGPSLSRGGGGSDLRTDPHFVTEGQWLWWFGSTRMQHKVTLLAMEARILCCCCRRLSAA